MKILFAYFDFTACYQQSSALHELGECSLNFSTEYNYSINKTIDLSSHTCLYSLSRQKKPDGECIPSGFWGKQFYNISAIVGNNGSGKSTVLHNIMRSIVYGLNPYAPFLLVLEASDSDRTYVFCNDSKLFVCDKDLSLPIQNEYPKDLMKAKCMLLDNTLSLSSLQLTNEYNNCPEIKTDKYWDFSPAWGKQLYNRSLYASIQYSNKKAIPSEKGSESVSVDDIISNYFSYESFQSIQFLFDPYHQWMLKTLEQQGHPVPKTKHLYVFLSDTLTTPFHSVLQELIDHIVVPMCTYHNLIFTDKIIIGAITSLICYLYNYITHDDKRDSLVDYLLDKDFSFDNTKDTLIGKTLQIINVIDDYSSISLFNNTYSLSYDKWRLFLSFVAEEKDTLLDIFQPSSHSSVDSTQYIINIENTTYIPHKQQCMVSFLEFYSHFLKFFPFITFFSGMSSGEKNLLRMLTQFRYILAEPSYYPEYEADPTEKHLQNFFAKKGSFACDTFFLFLDEADMTYHPEWQRTFISMLTDILPLVFRDPLVQDKDDTSICHDIQIFISTHSPLMLGDFPKASVNYLKTQSSNYTLPDPIHQRSAFGENLYTILKDGFFLDSPLGMFASNKINKAAEWCTKIRNNNFSPEQVKELELEYKTHYQTAQLLAPGIIKNKLLLELSFCADKLVIHDEEIDPDTLRQHIADLEAELQKARAKLHEKEQDQ